MNSNSQSALTGVAYTGTPSASANSNCSAHCNVNVNVINVSEQSDLSTLSLDVIYSMYTIIDELERFVPPVFICLGVPGNAMCAFFWLQRRIRSSSSVYLASLALAQLCFLLLYTLFYLERNYGHVIGYPVFCEFFIITYYAAQYLHSFLTAAFTLERWYAVTFPFQAHKLCNVRKATLVSGSLALAAFLFAAVQLVFWRYNPHEQSCNLNDAVQDPSTFEHRFWSVWTWVIEMTLFAAIPIVVLIFNVFVIVTTHRIAQKDKKVQAELKLPRRSSEECGGSRRGSHSSASVTTVTLLCISFYFICATLPVAVCTSLFFEHPSGDRSVHLENVANDPTWSKHLAYHTAKVLIDTFAVSQYCCAFYIYLLTSRMFRVQIRNQCCAHRSVVTTAIALPSSKCSARQTYLSLSKQRPKTRASLDDQRVSHV